MISIFPHEIGIFGTRGCKTTPKTFGSVSTVHSLLGGIGSIEELWKTDGSHMGMGVHVWRPELGKWADHWTSADNGVVDGESVFISEEKVNGVNWQYRGVWDQVTLDSCRWHQSASKDSGTSWDWNGWMDWTRQSAHSGNRMTKVSDVIQVSPDYRHYDKVVRSHGVIDSTIDRLKWYEVSADDQPIAKAIRDPAQSCVSRKLTSDGKPSAQELGFVLLHRCGDGFYFLGLCTWRGNNELWKTIFCFETDAMEDFALFEQDEPHKDTFCVWELAVVSHETRAWTIYLRSNRTERDADRYLTTVI